MTFSQTTGSRAQVWHGTAKKTSGGLTKSHLMMNKHGRIVSRKQHSRGKSAIKRLFKLGFKPKKGTFKVFKKHHGHKKGGAEGEMPAAMPAMGEMPAAMPAMGEMPASASMSRARSSSRGRSSGRSSSRGRSRKMRGGMAYGGPLSPLAYDGKGVGTSGVDLQFVAGNAA